MLVGNPRGDVMPRFIELHGALPRGYLPHSGFKGHRPQSVHGVVDVSRSQCRPGVSGEF